MADIADGESLLRASIVGEMVTAAGIVALGTLLFTVLRRHGGNVAAVALGLSLVEAALLAMREVLVFAPGDGRVSMPLPVGQRKRSRRRRRCWNPSSIRAQTDPEVAP